MCRQLSRSPSQSLVKPATVVQGRHIPPLTDSDRAIGRSLVLHSRSANCSGKFREAYSPISVGVRFSDHVGQLLHRQRVSQASHRLGKLHSRNETVAVTVEGPEQC
ncbi:hypothetical protein Mapa_005522 [Marchantia paleacea]|nr:hypothetical protein Mapa_005522 [Marchantia paleacea]